MRTRIVVAGPKERLITLLMEIVKTIMGPVYRRLFWGGWLETFQTRGLACWEVPTGLFSTYILKPLPSPILLMFPLEQAGDRNAFAVSSVRYCGSDRNCSMAATKDR